MQIKWNFRFEEEEMGLSKRKNVKYNNSSNRKFSCISLQWYSMICFRSFHWFGLLISLSTYCIVSTGKRLASTKRSNELLVHRVFIMFMYAARPFLLCSNQPKWRPKHSSSLHYSAFTVCQLRWERFSLRNVLLCRGAV